MAATFVDLQVVHARDVDECAASRVARVVGRAGCQRR